jgi:putative ATP-grasp target RiPP
MIQSSGTPWGVSRMRPFPEGEANECAGAVLDPWSQTARWFDADGIPLPGEGKHKKPRTFRETKPRTSLDGNRDEGRDQETD